MRINSSSKKKAYTTHENNKTYSTDERNGKLGINSNDSNDRQYARGRATKSDTGSDRFAKTPVKASEKPSVKKPMKKPTPQKRSLKTGNSTRKRTAEKKAVKAPSFGNYYLEVLADGTELRWNENFLGILPPGVYIPVLGQIFAMLVKYTGAEETGLRIDAIRSRVAPVKFAVEVSENAVNISGLDEFEIDLDNGIYTVPECFALMTVLGQLMETA